MIEVTLAKHSRPALTKGDVDLFTFVAKVHHFVHVQMLRHRAFSFSVLSNRAVGIGRVAKGDTAYPLEVRKNQLGMQGDVVLTTDEQKQFNEWLDETQDMVLNQVLACSVDVHKQTLNRYISPFKYTHMIFTTTRSGLNNFLSLRLTAEAQPEIRILAEKIEAAVKESTPQTLNYGEWHIPFVTFEELMLYKLDVVLKLSAFRCARESYGFYLEGKKYQAFEEVEKCNLLIQNRHISPLEHQAMYYGNFAGDYLDGVHIFRNVYPYVQFRAMTEETSNTTAETYYEFIREVYDNV